MESNLTAAFATRPRSMQCVCTTLDSYINGHLLACCAYSMQITSAYVPPVATQVFGAVPLNQTCIDTCEAERDAQIMPNAYGETTCNNLLPTYPSSAAVFPCNAQRLPHSISQGFAIVFAPQPQSA